MPVKFTWEEYAPDDPIFREVYIQIGGRPPVPPRPAATPTNQEQPVQKAVKQQKPVSELEPEEPIEEATGPAQSAIRKWLKHRKG